MFARSRGLEPRGIACIFLESLDVFNRILAGDFRIFSGRFLPYKPRAEIRTRERERERERGLNIAHTSSPPWVSEYI